MLNIKKYCHMVQSQISYCWCYDIRFNIVHLGTKLSDLIFGSELSTEIVLQWGTCGYLKSRNDSEFLKLSWDHLWYEWVILNVLDIKRYELLHAKMYSHLVLIQISCCWCQAWEKYIVQGMEYSTLSFSTIAKNL